uniref:Uncharacterized protein n=1 Tax=Glossina brevipalpis TaxID=37001 RepID=A0A1A9W697_9MUSC
MLRPKICMDVTWAHKSWFSFAIKSTCTIQTSQPSMAWFEAAFFSLLALFGYSFDGPATKSPEKNLADFENAMMGIKQKYHWISIMPWIITFCQNWFTNIYEYVTFFHMENIYDAENRVSCIGWLVACMVIQLVLAGEARECSVGP